VREQQRCAPHARSRQRRFRAGMAATDDDDIEMLGVKHAGFLAKHQCYRYARLPGAALDALPSLKGLAKTAPRTV
jgi:hypothetical protein